LGQQPGGSDFWISNPPYLLPGDAGETEPEVAAFEPAEALFAPAGDPLYFYRRMAQGARLLVKPMGWIWVEIPHERADALKAVFDEPGLGFQKVKLIHDLTGRPRVLAAQWMGNKS
jgi:release factor glutamine methyltransferase